MTESVKNLLSSHAREEIDRWIAKYPADQKQSAVLAACREVQHENQGILNHRVNGRYSRISRHATYCCL